MPKAKRTTEEEWRVAAEKALATYLGAARGPLNLAWRWFPPTSAEFAGAASVFVTTGFGTRVGGRIQVIHLDGIDTYAGATLKIRQRRFTISSVDSLDNIGAVLVARLLLVASGASALEQLAAVPLGPAADG